MRIELARLDWDSDLSELENDWRDLEQNANGSFFQSWTWIGCRVRSRFCKPFVVRATEGGVVVGLALFNRRGPPRLRTLWLHETGDPREDSVFIEHNGPLVACGRDALLRPMLEAALEQGRVMLNGVGDAVRDAACSLGLCRVLASRPAPYASLVGADAATWLSRLGRSTRYQLRRSRRRYEAEGVVTLRRAGDVEEALAFFGGLATLHQQRWTARGLPGAFAEPAFVAFHQTLIARGLPRGEVELLRVSVENAAGERVIGYLYNFIWRATIYAYQGGFDYDRATPHEKPGLTCHHFAIEAAIATQSWRYDFLAGKAQYKENLADGAALLHWMETARAYGAFAVQMYARRWLRRLKSNLWTTAEPKIEQ